CRERAPGDDAGRRRAGHRRAIGPLRRRADRSVISQELLYSRFERNGELRLPDFEQTPYVFAVFPGPGGGFPRWGDGLAGHYNLLPDRGPDAQAAGATMRARADWGRMARPSCSSAPPSSKITTPLHRRLQPCSGWLALILAPLRSWARARGHRGRCGHCCSPDCRAALRGWMVVMSHLLERGRRAVPRGHDAVDFGEVALAQGEIEGAEAFL